MTLDLRDRKIWKNKQFLTLACRHSSPNIGSSRQQKILHEKISSHPSTYIYKLFNCFSPLRVLFTFTCTSQSFWYIYVDFRSFFWKSMEEGETGNMLFLMSFTLLCWFVKKVKNSNSFLRITINIEWYSHSWIRTHNASSHFCDSYPRNLTLYNGCRFGTFPLLRTSIAKTSTIQ